MFTVGPTHSPLLSVAQNSNPLKIVRDMWGRILYVFACQKAHENNRLEGNRVIIWLELIQILHVFR
jgi:hypothetical protein